MASPSCWTTSSQLIPRPPKTRVSFPADSRIDLIFVILMKMIKILLIFLLDLMFVISMAIVEILFVLLPALLLTQPTRLLPAPPLTQRPRPLNRPRHPPCRPFALGCSLNPSVSPLDASVGTIAMTGTVMTTKTHLAAVAASA